MDAALKREREDFKRRAMAVPVVENKKRKVEDTSTAKKSGSSSAPKSGKSGPSFTSKYSSGGSNYKFGVLGENLEIVRFIFFVPAVFCLSVLKLRTVMKALMIYRYEL